MSSLPTCARLCTDAAHACAFGVLAVPFAARVLCPAPEVREPQGPVGLAYLAARRATSSNAERRRCLLPLPTALLAVVASAVIEERLPEFRP